jgi:hypothetical protein
MRVAVTVPNLATLAQSYLAGGLSVVPVGGDKRACVKWEGLQQRPADPEQVKQWMQMSRTRGVAAVCGGVSGGLLIVDFDEAGFYERWLELVGDDVDGLPVQRTGSGGYQVAVQCDDPGRNVELAHVPDVAQQSGRRVAIETRGEGGYAVLPGSMHPSGNRYEVVSGDWREVPNRPQSSVDFLLACARKLDQAPLTRQQLLAAARQAKPRSRENLNGTAGVIDTWNAQHPINDTLLAYGYVPFGRDRFTRPGADASPGGVVILCGRSYHHSTNDALHDGHTHDSFDVYTTYAHNGDIKTAVKAAAVELGIGPPVRSSAQSASVGGATVLSQREHDAQTWAVKPASALVGGGAFDWIWQNYLSRGYSTLLSGYWKSGKSTLLVHVLRAMAKGGVVGTEVFPCRVLVITEESEDNWARRRDDFDLGDHIDFIIRPFRGRPTQQRWEAFAEDIAEKVTTNGYGLVIFDTLSAVCSTDDENDSAKMTQALKPFNTIADAGAAVLVVHHTTKAESASRYTAARGSGAISSFFDVLVTFKPMDTVDPHDRRRVLGVVGRLPSDQPEIVLELSQDGYTYNLIGTKAAAKRDDRLDVVNGLLAKSDLSKTPKQIREEWPAESGIPKPSQRTVTDDLAVGEKDGRYVSAIAPAMGGKGGRSTRAYCLSNPIGARKASSGRSDFVCGEGEPNQLEPIRGGCFPIGPSDQLENESLLGSDSFGGGA